MTTPGIPGGSVLQRLATGIPMSFTTLKLLTVLPPTGMLGMNHAALGNQALALLKATSVAISIVLVTFLLPYYPYMLHQPIIWLSRFGPWFLFDILEVFNSSFSSHGFRIPLNITIEGLTPERGTDGKWILNTAMASAIMAALATSGVVIANYLPPSLVPASASSTLSTVAGGSGLALGVLAIGLMLTSSSSGTAATQTLTPVVPQHGGGLPPLSSFADKLINAKSPDESLAFLSTIAVIIVGGILTAAFQK
jgi:hypothetical protein